MHAILVTLGTDGDVFPYIGLGMKLRARGHRVTLATSEQYQAAARENGFDFRPLLSAAEADEFLASPDIWHPIKCGIIAARWGVRFIPRQYELLAELASDPKAVFVANPGVLAARVMQDKLKKPLASVILQPWLIPSIHAPPVMPGPNLPRWSPYWVNWLHFRMIDALGSLLVGRDVNRLRKSLGLQPVKRIFRWWWLSPDLVIGMFPEWYGPPQRDWPKHIRLAGFPIFDGRKAGSLPEDVLAFCKAGSPPVAFTLGTGMRFAAEFFREAVEACRILGRRGILLTKFPELVPQPLPDFTKHCTYAPFRELFPHCAAVVHHGGIGTTAKTLASGTPHLVLPLAWDQMDNAVRVKRLGVGISLGPRRRTAEPLAEALRGLITPQTQEYCRSLADRIGRADALDVAASWLEELSCTSNLSRQPPFDALLPRQ